MKLINLKSLVIISLVAVAAISSAQQSSTVENSFAQTTSLSLPVSFNLDYYLSVAFANGASLSGYVIRDGGNAARYDVGNASFTVTSNWNTKVHATMTGSLSALDTNATWWTNFNIGVLADGADTSFVQGSNAAIGNIHVGVQGLSYSSNPSSTPYTGTLTLTFTQQ